jgi:hypothetical protein
MKKHAKFALTLTLLALLLAIGSCKGSTGGSGAEDPAASGGAETALPMKQGSWEGNTFTNEWAGLKLELPDGWTAASKEQMESAFAAGEQILINDSVYSESQLDLAKIQTVYDFLISKEGGMPNAILMYENLLLSGAGSMSVEEYFETLKGQLVQVTTMGYEFVDKASVRAAGEEWLVGSFKVSGSGVQKYYLRKIGDCIACLAVTMPDGDETVADALLAGLSKPE